MATITISADYTMVAEARGQRVLWYRQFGSYQGEWLLMSCDDSMFYVYKGWYGSCSGCDAIQHTFDGDVDPASEEVQKFIADYPSFLEMRREAAVRVVRANDGNLTPVLPKNQRTWGVDEGPDDLIGRQLALVVLAETGEISATEILELDNMETRRTAIEHYDAQRFRDEVGGRLIDRDGPDELWHVERPDVEDYAFLYLKDGSTDRRYVLRVDPVHETVLAARAASFGIPPERFTLAVET